MTIGPVHMRLEVRPSWPYRLALRGSPDGLWRVRGGVLERLVHVGDRPVLVRAAQPSADQVVIGAYGRDRFACASALERLRWALALDEDLRAFQRAFRDDPLIGPSVRARPWLRVLRAPDPFQALAWAICEQLIEYERAVAIERRLVRRLGRRCPQTGLRDAPSPQAIAAAAPAEFQEMDLAGARALTLIRVARETIRGRLDLHDSEHEQVWRRLRAIPGVGSWTIAMFALHGQGRHDLAPAGDVGLLKLVGRVRSGGDPYARASEAEVLGFLAPYGKWAGLAAMHLMSWPRAGLAAQVACVA